MFIRCTRTRSRSSGEPYVTYRLVQTARVGRAVKQTTLLNLGSRFDLPQDQWAALAVRIDELLRGQASLLDPALSDAGQVLAQRYAAQLIALRPSLAPITATATATAATAAAGPALAALWPPRPSRRAQARWADIKRSISTRSTWCAHAAWVWSMRRSQRCASAGLMTSWPNWV